MTCQTVLLGLAALAFAGIVAADGVPDAARVVREEALRSQQDPGGRPLPLIAHWHRKTLPLSYQLELIERGYPILPWMDYSRTTGEIDVDKASLRRLREWGLPLTLLTGGQWEQDFYLAPEYVGKPLSQTGLADNAEGVPIKKVSPFSPVAPWRELGTLWTNNANAKAIQAAYPDPPLVLFISNNEAQKLRWTEAESSKTYLNLHGPGQSGLFRRQVFGDGWIERYSALFDGMRSGLVEEQWRRNSRFVGYSAFGNKIWGRYGGWREYSLVTEDRIGPEWYAWNGASVDVYDNHWESPKSASNLWSMQTEVMNLPFQREEAFKVQPEFWLELLVWDGNVPGDPRDNYVQYANRGTPYTPALYGGWVQYSLWILMPRVAREWRGWLDERNRWWAHYEAVMAGVLRVHNDPVLRRFWRESKLVPNLSRPHPFRHFLPAKWLDPAVYPRWFHLETSTDPVWPAEFSTSDYAMAVPVWTLARVAGVAPKREWLIYAYAPLGERTKVEVELPGFGTVTLPKAAIGGSFYHLVETSKELTEVGLASGPLRKPSPPSTVDVN